MGGKSAKPTIPSYEPYQCCPAKVKGGTKVAKVSPVSSRPKIKIEATRKPRPTEPPPFKPINKLSPKDSKKTATAQPVVKDAKTAKGKRGFFGSVVAGLPYLIRV
ncbi:uncharacterized protein LOC105697602 [Orussus abietinus]|uniref:uncharacterized protein LOC105697602 n=1 Tax=Orussus abietinus TaxID=222816 RepID=UPI000625444C|nr:uncharacterized protein LOC105697602 [Orussus abietinus]